MSYLREHDEHVAREDSWSVDVLYIESHLGTVMIEACDQCPLCYVSCTHEHCTWNDAGTVLSCNLCGTDAT